VIEYRMMKITEINEVANLYGAMARELAEPGAPGDEGAVELWTINVFRCLSERGAANRSVIFIAVCAGRIAGFIQGQIYYDAEWGKYVGRVYAMYVSPEFRGRWIAHKLMKAIEKWGRGVGMEAAVVHAAPGNEGAYERFGFKIVSLKMAREY
jgi:GNAT superfamily N-acetyltransferase